MEILNGKLVSKKIKDKLKQQILKLDSKPKLVVIKVGDNPASEVYVRNKEKECANIGMSFRKIEYQETNNEQLVNIIEDLNNDDSVSGIIVQLPLPDNIDARTVLDAIDAKKDVDGLTTYNIGALQVDKEYHLPCTPKGVIRLLEEYNIEIGGKNVVIVGRSNLVGKPLAQLFLNKDATVTICHSATKNLLGHTKNADILVCAVGKKDLITKDMVKDNVVVIDVGINRIDNKLYGDVDFENVKDKCSYITPVPGGVGPMTIAMLLQNTYNAKIQD